MRRDLTRQAFAIKIIPYRAMPILYEEPLTVDTKRRAFCDVFSVLARKEALVRYHWDTPAYRQLCAEMGLDPDEGRPRYREAFAGIAGELERWLGNVFTDGAEGSSPAFDTKAAAFDLLDLMRVDRPRDPTLLEALRRRWVRVDPSRMPRYSELEQLIETEALLLQYATAAATVSSTASGPASLRPNLPAVMTAASTVKDPFGQDNPQ